MAEKNYSLSLFFWPAAVENYAVRSFILHWEQKLIGRMTFSAKPHSKSQGGFQMGVTDLCGRDRTGNADVHVRCLARGGRGRPRSQ